MLICISCAILICATTAKAKHTRVCDNLISVHQNSARGKQRAQLALLKYSHFFLALRYNCLLSFLRRYNSTKFLTVCALLRCSRCSAQFFSLLQESLKVKTRTAHACALRGAGERNREYALLMTANKSETAVYRAPIFSLLLASHGGITSCVCEVCLILLFAMYKLFINLHPR